MAALSSGAITTSTTYPQQPRAEETGLLVSGFRVRDGHHPFTDDRALNYPEAVEVSCKQQLGRMIGIKQFNPHRSPLDHEGRLARAGTGDDYPHRVGD